MNRDPELGKPIQDIILGSVVLFEIIGPLFIRRSLLRTGEIPLAQAIHHTSRTPLEQLRSLVDRFRSALQGTSATPMPGSKVKVKDLLRKTKSQRMRQLRKQQPKKCLLDLKKSYLACA